VHVVVDMECEPPGVVLEEPEDCARFDVTVRGGRDAGALDDALRSSAVGTVDGEGEALVGVDAVRRLAKGLVAETWEADFAAMLDYAGTKGWLSDDGGSIRAHVEWG
jgi:hypothetical protein